MTSTLSLLAIALVLLYAGWLFVLWRFQERIVFQPPANVAASILPAVAARRVEYRAADGLPLFAYVVGDCSPDTPDTPVVLAFHGNAEIARWLVPWAAAAADATNACVVLPEYRGYDGLAGDPSYATSQLDAQAALDYARSELHVPASRTIYFGHSLGTAIAAELAAHDPPRSLVLQAPFSSAREMARRMVVPGATALWGIISRVHFDTVARVRALRVPVFVSHGDRDMVVPVRMGRDVFEAAACKGALLIVAGGTHNDVAEKGGTNYWEWLRAAVAPSPTAMTGPSPRAETPPAP